jgi:hypothetical protein
LLRFISSKQNEKKFRIVFVKIDIIKSEEERRGRDDDDDEVL